MTCEELIDEYMSSNLKEKEEMIKNFEEHYKWMQNNGYTVVNTELNQTNENNADMFDMENWDSEDLYYNFYSDDDNSDEDTNDESDESD